MVLEIVKHELHEHFVAHQLPDRVLVYLSRIVIIECLFDFLSVLFEQLVLKAMPVVEVESNLEKPKYSNVTTNFG